MRKTGQLMELQTVNEYSAAINSAKEAIKSKSNSEVRIVENKYDETTRKEKKQVIKILTPESAGGSSGRSAKNPVVTRETANQATKGFISLVLAVTVLILLAGIMIPLAMR
jgi:hypothetical protein